MPNHIDYSFLSELEGGSETIGYVPAAAISRSGVTIATGFDLGQRNEADLVRLGLSGSLIAMLLPYLGMTGMAAHQYVARHPLAITGGESMEIDRAVKAEHVSLLERKYLTSPHNTKRSSFFSLPPEAQTAIASVSFQYGVNLDVRAPRFWHAAAARDWKQAVEELKKFGDAYPTRRRREADLLKRVLR